MTEDVAQRLAELQAQAADLRIAVAVVGAVAVMTFAVALAIWSCLRKLYRLQLSQAHHVEAAGAFAAARLREQARRRRRLQERLGVPSAPH